MFNLIFGAIAMGCVVAGLFFLRFWRETRDRLFFMFAMAFFILAVERVILGLNGATAEDRVNYLYLFRLAAFLLILIAILDKNRGRSQG